MKYRNTYTCADCRDTHCKTETVSTFPYTYEDTPSRCLFEEKDAFWCRIGEENEEIEKEKEC